MKLFKLLIVITAMTASVNVLIGGDAAAGGLLSQEMLDRQSAVDWEKPSLSSPAAAAHAESLARAAAGKADEKVAQAQQAVDEAEAALAEAKNSGDQTAMGAAQERYDVAVRAFNDAVAKTTGVSTEEISEMRTSGMGWGQIAHELGVHPGVLGLGHADRGAVDEVEMATARNTKTGLSVGHGATHGGKGVGLDRAESKKGVGNGIDGKDTKTGGHNVGTYAGGYGHGRGNANGAGHGSSNAGGRGGGNNGGHGM